MDLLMKPELQPHEVLVHRHRKLHPQPSHIFGDRAMAATASDMLSHAVVNAKEQSREQMRAASEQRTSDKPYSHGGTATPLRRGKAHVGPVSIAAEFPRGDPSHFLGSGKKRVENPASESVNIASPTAYETGRHRPSSIANSRKNPFSPPSGRLVASLSYPKVGGEDSPSRPPSHGMSRAHTPSSEFRLEYAEKREPVGPAARRSRAPVHYVPPSHLIGSARCGLGPCSPLFSPDLLAHPTDNNR
jgi:hypothetical protein